MDSNSTVIYSLFLEKRSEIPGKNLPPNLVWRIVDHFLPNYVESKTSKLFLSVMFVAIYVTTVVGF